MTYKTVMEAGELDTIRANETRYLDGEGQGHEGGHDSITCPLKIVYGKVK
jgi:hypothetical protein